MNKDTINTIGKISGVLAGLAAEETIYHFCKPRLLCSDLPIALLQIGGRLVSICGGMEAGKYVEKSVTKHIDSLAERMGV